MRHHGYQNHNQYADFSPLRQNYSLSVEDIPGAKPKQRLATKNTNHYEDKLAEDRSPFFERQKLHEQLYTNGNYHQGGINLSTQKKHFNAHHSSEIAEHNLMIRNDGSSPHLNSVEFPRNLATDDIPGAKAGTLQSKTVKNHDLAHRIREGQLIEDSLDHFQQQKRSYSPSPYTYGSRDFSHGAPKENYHHQPRSHSNHPAKRVTYEDAYDQPYNQRASVNGLESMNQRPISNQRLSAPAGYDAAYNLYNQQQQQQQQYQQQQQQYRPPSNSHNYHPQPVENYQRQPPVERQPEPQNYEAYPPRQNESYNHNQSYGQMREEQIPQPIQTTSPVKTNMKTNGPIKATDIIQSQGALEKKYYDNLKGRTFNIISGFPASSIYANGARKAYGSSLNAMQKNVEGYRRAELRSWNPSEQTLNNTNQTVDERREMDSLGFAGAGKMNDYSDNNIRYGNRPQDKSSPLDPSQLYGTRALKNLSGVGF